MPDTTAAARLDLADVEARIERHRLRSDVPRKGDRDFVDLSRLIDHDAPALLAVLRHVQALHSEFRIYDECGHQHTETDVFVRDIADVGLVCEEGFMYSVCRHCCTDASGDQTEECASSHDHSRWLCPTRQAIEETQS